MSWYRSGCCILLQSNRLSGQHWIYVSRQGSRSKDSCRFPRPHYLHALSRTHLRMFRYYLFLFARWNLLHRLYISSFLNHHRLQQHEPRNRWECPERNQANRSPQTDERTTDFHCPWSPIDNLHSSRHEPLFRYNAMDHIPKNLSKLPMWFACHQ